MLLLQPDLARAEFAGETPFTPEDIIRFVLSNDSGEVFQTAKYHMTNFSLFVTKLFEANQGIVYTNKDGNIAGICLWAMVKEEDRDRVNKTRWLLPDNITDGENLYVGLCLVTFGCNILKIKTYLEGRYTGKVKEAYWFRDKWYRRRFDANT